MSAASIPHDYTNETIDSGRLRISKLIGFGGFGAIYLAHPTDVACASPSSPSSPFPPSSPFSSSSYAAKVIYAVKVIPKPRTHTPQYSQLRAEIALHARVAAHPHVVTLHRVVEDARSFLLVMQYAPGGDMFTLLAEVGFVRELKAESIEAADFWVRRTFLQVVDAVEFCHEQGVFHRDLKPENLLLSEDGQEVYLADFGLATTEEFSSETGFGSAAYMAPECIGHETFGRTLSTRTADVWALGIVLCNLITASLPWESATSDDPRFNAYLSTIPEYALDRVLEPSVSRLRKNATMVVEAASGMGGLRMSRAAHRMLKRMLVIDPKGRAGLKEIRWMTEEIRTFFAEEDDAEEDDAEAETETMQAVLTDESELLTQVQLEAVVNEVIDDMDEDDEDNLAFRLYVGRHALPAEQLTQISLDDLPEIPSEEAPRPLFSHRHAKDAGKHVHFGLDTSATPLRVVIPSEPYTAPNSAVSAASSASVYSQPDSAASEDDSLLHMPYVRPTLEARSSLEVYPPHRRIVPHVFIKSPVSPAPRSAVESLLREPCPDLDELDSFDEGMVPEIMPGAWFSPHIGADVQEDGESDDESEGPITPETYAVAPDVTIEDVPELCLEVEDGRTAKAVDAVGGKGAETRDVGLLERIAAWSVDCA